MPSLRRRSMLLGLLAFAAASTLALIWLWNQDALRARFRHWLDQRLIRSYVERIQPRIPFKIEDVDIDGSFKDLAAGKLATIRAVLSWKGYRVRVHGPLEISRDPEEPLDVWLTYRARATIEPVGGARVAGAVSDPMQLDLAAQIEPTRLGIGAVSFDAEAARWNWGLHGIESERFLLTVDWAEDETLDLNVEAASITWTHPAAKDQALGLTRLKLTTEVPLALSPEPRLGPVGKLKLSAQGAEALSGETYLDLPLADFPASLEVEFGDGNRPTQGDLRVGGTRALRLKLDPSYGPGGRLRSVAAAWNAPGIPTAGIVAWLARFPSLGRALNDLSVNRGKLSSRGNATIELGPDGNLDVETSRIEGVIEASGIDLRWNTLGLATRALAWRVPFDSTRGIPSAWLEAKRIAYRKFVGKLERTPFSIAAKTPRDLRAGRFDVDFDRGIRIAMDSLPLSLGPIRGKLEGGRPTLHTSLTLDGTDAAILGAGLCIPASRLPPARVHAEFPRIEITRDTLEPQGSARAELLGGTIDLGELVAYDLGTEFPEFHFDAYWKGIRLDLLNRWIRFGEMDGLIEGHATDFVIRDGRATEFDFLFRIKPHRKTQVVFSARAMRNFVKFITGGAMDSLPGFMNWVMFGLPARLVGGYDIQYAGIRATSRDGTTVIETLDPPRTGIAQAEGITEKHYILYGDRFKIPLNSSRYPVVMDAAAIGTTVGQMTATLAEIARSSSETDPALNKETPDETPDAESDQPCLPPEL